MYFFLLHNSLAHNTWDYSPKCLDTFFNISQKIVNNLINENWFPFNKLLKVSSLEHEQYLRITKWCQNTHFTYKILQYTCFNWTYYTCWYVKWLWDISQYNKLSDFQYARFQIVVVNHHFGLVWSHGIPNMLCKLTFPTQHAHYYSLPFYDLFLD